MEVGVESEQGCGRKRVELRISRGKRLGKLRVF
jgi:hypothetical protein